MHSESLQHRVRASGNNIPAHGAGLREIDRQQRNPSHNQQFAVLAGRKAVTEHAAKILDADKIGRKNIRHADRIDEIGTHGFPLTRHAKEGFCVSGQRSSMGLPTGSGAMVNQSFQEAVMTDRTTETVIVYSLSIAFILGMIAGVI